MEEKKPKLIDANKTIEILVNQLITPPRGSGKTTTIMLTNEAILYAIKAIVNTETYKGEK